MTDESQKPNPRQVIVAAIETSLLAQGQEDRHDAPLVASGYGGGELLVDGYIDIDRVADAVDAAFGGLTREQRTLHNGWVQPGYGAFYYAQGLTPPPAIITNEDRWVGVRMGSGGQLRYERSPRRPRWASQFCSG